MNTRTIVATLAGKRALLEARVVRHLALFGSCARYDAHDDSDLDVLIDIDPDLSKFSLIDLARVCNLLTDITGIESVAIERRLLVDHPAFAKHIGPDIVEVF